MQLVCRPGGPVHPEAAAPAVSAQLHQADGRWAAGPAWLSPGLPGHELLDQICHARYALSSLPALTYSITQHALLELRMHLAHTAPCILSSLHWLLQALRL